MSMADALNKAGYAKTGTGVEKHGVRQQERNDPPSNRPKEPPAIQFRSGEWLRREILTIDALEWANALRGVSNTQLRNFYNEVKSLQARIETGGFEKNSALVGMLKAKVAYAFARADSKSKDGFAHLKRMIESCVDLSDSEQAFNDFALFFEAVLGFSKGER